MQIRQSGVPVGAVDQTPSDHRRDRFRPLLCNACRGAQPHASENKKRSFQKDYSTRGGRVPFYARRHTVRVWTGCHVSWGRVQISMSGGLRGAWSPPEATNGWCDWRTHAPTHHRWPGGSQVVRREDAALLHHSYILRMDRAPCTGSGTNGPQEKFAVLLHASTVGACDRVQNWQAPVSPPPPSREYGIAKSLESEGSTGVHKPRSTGEPCRELYAWAPPGGGSLPQNKICTLGALRACSGVHCLSSGVLPGLHDCYSSCLVFLAPGLVTRDNLTTPRGGPAAFCRVTRP